MTHRFGFPDRADQTGRFPWGVTENEQLLPSVEETTIHLLGTQLVVEEINRGGTECANSKGITQCALVALLGVEGRSKSSGGLSSDAANSICDPTKHCENKGESRQI